jgi:cephalosporin-C deacetylase-like acetyl esterase
MPSKIYVGRRQFLQGGALASLSPACLFGGPSHSGEMPDMLLAYLTSRLNALASRWDQERAKIRTAPDVEARNRFVREKFREMVHGFPERNPLSPVVVATQQRNGYRIENVMFQSRPNFWVTGNFYVPSTGAGTFPGVISPCGHYPLSRMEPAYQAVYINLVKAGFVVLAYDPIGQGERRQYWNPQTNQTEIATASTYEHSMPGQILLLMGEDLTHYRIWDGMRAIDYLETRPEVDKSRIACAGHSGGGTLTLFISALDERVKCAVVNEGGTGHRWPIEIRPGSRVGPSDVEQNLFPAAIHGADLCDLHVAIAPRPLLALIEDYNPRFNRAAEHIRARYLQLGVPEKFATGEATDPHAWTPKLRIATTDWLSRWLYGSPGPEREPDFETESPQSLYCTPNGSLRYSQHGDSIFTLMLKKQAQLPPKSAQVSASQIKELLHYRKHDGPLDPRLRVTTPRKGYSIEKLEFLSEPGIYIPTWVFVPETRRESYPAILFFNEAGKQADGMEFGLYERLVRHGNLVVAVDVRGIGETRPPHDNVRAGEFSHLFDVETAMSYMAWFMDESLFGMRVQDAVRTVDYLLSRSDVNKADWKVVGKGAGALWVLYAAALDSRIQDATCERGLISYSTLARTDRYVHGGSVFVRDVLKHFDLPQVAASIAGRRLTLISPVDAMKQRVPENMARSTYQLAFDAYRASGAEGRFSIQA